MKRIFWEIRARYRRVVIVVVVVVVFVVVVVMENVFVPSSAQANIIGCEKRKG